MTNALVCFVISAVSLIGAVRRFVANQVYRGAIDAALAGAQGGPIDVPERVKPYYDAAYLNKFISIAENQRTTLGKSALELYIRPTFTLDRHRVRGLLRSVPGILLARCLDAPGGAPCPGTCFDVFPDHVGRVWRRRRC